MQTMHRLQPRLRHAFASVAQRARWGRSEAVRLRARPLPGERRAVGPAMRRYSGGVVGGNSAAIRRQFDQTCFFCVVCGFHLDVTQPCKQCSKAHAPIPLVRRFANARSASAGGRGTARRARLPGSLRLRLPALCW
jgi:hypothetical protein